MVDTLTSDTVDAANDPFGINVGDIAPNRCTECGKGFEIKPGPGRKPKKCPDCRTTSSSTSTGSKTGNSVVAVKLENSINAMGAMTAMLLALGSPSDAAIISKKVPPLAKAAGQWGSENKRVRKVIENGANSLAAITVMVTLFDLVWSLLANHGLVPTGAKKPDLRVTDDGGVVYPFHSAEGSNV